MGGRLFSLEDELDTADDNPDSNTELRLHELVARAEREARRTSERMRLMARHRARKGLHQNGSRRPYGHTADWHSLVPHEAELLNEAAKRVAAGEAVFAIARDFTAREIPTVTRKTTWQHDVLRQMLLNARMVGKREYDDVLIDVDYMPATSPSSFGSRYGTSSSPSVGQGAERTESYPILLSAVIAGFR